MPELDLEVGTSGCEVTQGERRERQGGKRKRGKEKEGKGMTERFTQIKTGNAPVSRQC